MQPAFQRYIILAPKINFSKFENFGHVTIFGVKFLVQNFTTNILGKVTEAFDLIV